MKQTKGMLIAALFISALSQSCSKSNDAPAAPKSVTYSNAKITSLNVTSLPATKQDGGGWQNSGGPNVYFKITDPNGNVLITGSTINDVTSGIMPLAWNFTNALVITNLSTQYKIEFYNHNAILADDDMGGYLFDMSYFAGYPTSGSLINSPLQIKLAFAITWY